MKHVKLLLAAFLFIFSVSSCSKDDDYEPSGSGNNGGGGGSNNSTYTLTVWSDFNGNPISVYVNGNYKGTISKYYSNSPGCDAAGCVSVDFVTTGSYTYSASDGDHSWSGTGYITGSCNTLNLTL